MKAPRKYSFLSLFSGCGGFDLGFLQDGFTPLGAFDSDSDAVNNYNRNIGPIHQTDLTLGISTFSRLSPDVVIAGPPCQGFSTIGKRLVNDPRNELLLLAGKIAATLQPKVIVIENVAGVLSGTHAKYWKSLINLLHTQGYRTSDGFCQASELGMSQLRKRVILFGWRTQSELVIPQLKSNPGCLKTVLKDIDGAPNHSPHLLPKDSPLYAISKRISQGQKLSNVRGGSRAIHTWDIPEVFGKTTRIERKVLEIVLLLRRRNRNREFGDADPVKKLELNKELGFDSSLVVQSLLDKRYLRKVDGKLDLARTFNGKCRRLAWDSPSCTVDTRFGDPRYFLHPVEHRGFTVREAARIQGFPDSYIFEGDLSAQFRLVGNAVPPPLGKFVASLTRQLLS